MKTIPYIFVCLLFLHTALATAPALAADHTAPSYMTVDEFYKKHPEQNKALSTFTKRVQQQGIPIPKGTQKKTVRIAFVYPGEQASDYWSRSITSFKKRMNEIGVKYIIDEYFSKPVVSTRTQQQQLNEALSLDPDYLVFTLDAMQHKRIIERLITRGRPKLILQNITTPLGIWEGKQPFMYVGFDHAIGTRMLADYFIQHTPQGNYGLLYAGRGYISDMRGKTFTRFLKANSELILSSAFFTDINVEKAANATNEILKETDVAFIYACTTDIAMGAIKSLRAAGKLGQVRINGWGGGSRELEAIMQGELDVTVMRMNDDNGVAMAEAIRLDIEGKGDSVPTVYSGEFVLVEKGIAPKKLEHLKQRAFRYSGDK